MTKQELVEAVAERLETSRANAAKIIDTLFAPGGVIGTELKKGGKVQITGFGNFEARQRAARQVRNPRTGGTIDVEASTVPAFRAGKALKDLLNQK